MTADPAPQPAAPSLAEIDALLARIPDGYRAGPWVTETCNSGEECWCRLIVPADPTDPDEDYILHSGCAHKNDAPLIAASPELLDAARTLRAEVSRLTDALAAEKAEVERLRRLPNILRCSCCDACGEDPEYENPCANVIAERARLYIAGLPHSLADARAHLDDWGSQDDE